MKMTLKKRPMMMTVMTMWWIPNGKITLESQKWSAKKKGINFKVVTDAGTTSNFDVTVAVVCEHSVLSCALPSKRGRCSWAISVWRRWVGKRGKGGQGGFAEFRQLNTKLSFSVALYFSFCFLEPNSPQPLAACPFIIIIAPDPPLKGTFHDILLN